MAKKKSVSKTQKSDQFLMLIAAAAAVIVGFFAIFAYKSQSAAMIAPTSTPLPTVISLSLDSQNNSGEMGSATLKQTADGKVIVTLSLVGFPKYVIQPAHIHVGSCSTLGAIKYPLTSVVNGQSITTINTTLAALQAMGPLAINVHKSVPQSGVYVSCGDIKF